MITAFHKALAAKRNENEEGFTLIELLVVVLIIGILAAIAIPVFLGQQDQAKDSAVKSDLANAKTAMISYATENDGTNLVVSDATATAAALGNDGYKQSDNDTSGVAVVTSTTAGAFCLQATSSTTKIFHITDSSGVVDGACP